MGVVSWSIPFVGVTVVAEIVCIANDSQNPPRPPHLRRTGAQMEGILLLAALTQPNIDFTNFNQLEHLNI